MFTIKAIAPDGATCIYEAIQLKISPNKSYLEFIRPTSPELTECLLINGSDFSCAYIENHYGKTVESLRGQDPTESSRQ